MVRPFHKNHEYPEGDERYDPYWIAKEDFDKVKLELWDDLWGCDNSAIGLQGCFEPWRHVWDENNLKFFLLLMLDKTCWTCYYNNI